MQQEATSRFKQAGSNPNDKYEMKVEIGKDFSEKLECLREELYSQIMALKIQRQLGGVARDEFAAIKK